MATDDKELQKLESDILTLRERVATEEDKRLNREVSASNDIRKAELLAEKARLEGQLAQAKEANKVGAVKEGAAAPLEAAVADQKHAEEVRDIVAGN